MPKISVYVPDDLYDAVRRYGVPVSAVAQAALEAAVRRGANQEWIAAARDRRPRAHPIDTAALLRDVRDEFGT